MMDVFDGLRSRALTQSIWETDRFGDFRHFAMTADTVSACLKKAGCVEIKKLALTADGKTRYFDWVVPQAWDVYDAELTLILPDGGEERLCDYARTPLCAMMFSAPLARGQYRIVSADCPDWRESFVYTQDHPRDVVAEAVRRGAVGIVSDFFPDYAHVRGPDDDMDGACRWENDLFYPRNDTGLCGFSLSRKAGARLRAALARGESAAVSALMDTQLYDGTVYTVSGLIPGQDTDEEILLCAHLYEPGANDNATGCGMLCHLAEILNDRTKGKRRGVRFVMGYEAAGISGWAAAHPDILKRTVAALNCDMVGAAEGERAVLKIWDSPLTNGTFLQSLLSGIAKEADIPFETAAFDIGDCLIADPMLGVPCCSLVMHPARSYHSSLDTMDYVSGETLRKTGGMALRFIRALISPSQADAAFAGRCLTEAYDHIMAHREDPALPLRMEAFERAMEEYERLLFDDALSRVPVRLIPGAATMGGRFHGKDPELDPFYSVTLNTALFHVNGRRTLRSVIRRTCLELGLELNEETTGRFMRFFDEAVDAGLIAYGA